MRSIRTLNRRNLYEVFCSIQIYGHWNTAVNTTRKISSVEDVRNIERAIEDSNIFIEQAWLMNYVPIEEDISDCTDEMKRVMVAPIVYKRYVCSKCKYCTGGYKKPDKEESVIEYWSIHM